jgi:hypothetical protein
MSRVSQSRVRETLEELRRAESQLSGRPDRQREAQQHIAAVERVMLHPDFLARSSSTSATQIVKRARGFLLDFNDWGFMLDDQPG